MARKQKATPTQIEAQYDSGQNRLTQERSDFLLPQIIDFVRQKRWINIRPEYQRRLVWDQKKKSLFIESLLMNIPVPPVFLYETDLNRYEVMDDRYGYCRFARALKYGPIPSSKGHPHLISDSLLGVDFWSWAFGSEKGG